MTSQTVPLTAVPMRGPGYGARVVSLDTMRGLSLNELDPPDRVPVIWPFRVADLSAQQVADRLALSHWPWGHQIVVSSLAGGVGRTTIAGLLATTLAELGFAHIWPPIALAEAARLPWSSTARRLDLLADENGDASGPACTRSGAWVFLGGQVIRRREDFSTIVIDAVPGLPSANHTVAVDPRASILLVVRPDRTSIADAAEALVRMHDEHQVTNDQVVVLINHTDPTPADPGSRAAATALATRCAAVHRLPHHVTLGPGRPLPSGADLPTRVRRVVAAVALDLWLVATAHATPSRHRKPGGAP